MNKKSIGLICVLTIFVLLGSGLVLSKPELDSPKQKNYTSDKITITDSKGRQVVTPNPPHRIVSIGSGLETLLAFGVQQEIVAMSDYSRKRQDYKLFLPDIPDVGGSNKPNIEKVLAVNPDLVLGYAIYPYTEMRPVLAERGIPLVQLDFFIPEKYEQEVRTLGKVLRKESRAEELIEFENKHIGLIRDQVKHIKTEDKVRVYVESYQAYQIEGQKEMSRSATIGCGGINIFSDVPVNGSIVSAEAVVEKNPDIIIKLVNIQTYPSGYGITDSAVLASLRQEIMNRPGGQQINAVKNGKVYIISTDTKSIHPSVYYSYLAKWFYPECFQSLNPVSIHQAWFQQFFGIKRLGVYTYPES